MLIDRATEAVYADREFPRLVEPGSGPKEVLYYWGDGMDVTVYQKEVEEPMSSVPWQYAAWKGPAEAEEESVWTPWLKDIEDAAYLAMYSPALQVAAAKGAERLDEVHEGWAAAIDAEAIDVWHIDSCVTALLFGSYEKGLEAMGISPSNDGAVIDHGLAVADDWLDDLISDHARIKSHEMLNAYWRAEVGRRRVWQSPDFSVEVPEKGDRLSDLVYWGISPPGDYAQIELNMQRVDPGVAFSESR